MVEESLLLNEFSYINFSSYYYSSVIFNCIAKSDDEIFRIIVENVIENKIHSRYRFPCFGRLLRDLYKDDDNYEGGVDNELIPEDVDLYLVINTKKEETRRYGQWCWMGIEELKSHINQVKSLFDGFDVTIEPELRQGFICIKFLFRGKEISTLRMLYLLTWMRYSYEFASSMAMRDAYLIKSEIRPDLSIFNIMQATVKYLLYVGGILGDQTICPKGVFQSDETLRKKLLSNWIDCLSELYATPNLAYTHSKDSKLERESINWWLDKDTFLNTRLPIHLENIEILTKYYKENEQRESN